TGLGRVGLEAALGLEPAVTVNSAITRSANPFGPDHFETGCGIKIRGMSITTAWSHTAQVDDDLGGELARVDLVQRDAANVALTFADGTGGVLPVVRDFLTVLRFVDGTLVDVSFEPSANSWRREDYEARRDELEQLRGIVATAFRYGAFRLDHAGAEQLAVRMQHAKGVDPAMAVYAAYGYDGIGREDLIEQMQSYLRADLGIRLFDIALLGGDLAGTAGHAEDLFPPMPMLAQGFALLDAQRVEPSPLLRQLRGHLAPSVWTLFDAEGAARLDEILTEAG
ncbi:MAG: hypothetical protein L0K86_13245, partial [Actinomycetia bacterium]|nr:hypothetical protein [Actinomycetes bacterium]